MRQLFALTVILAFFASSLLLAADPGAKPAAPKAIPIVAIIKNDGASLRGKLLDANPGSITIEVTSDPTQKDPVQIPWSDIKSLSNGLTQSKAAIQWKADHKPDLCTTCHGDQTVTCGTCKGTVKDLSARTDCPKCKGAGTMACITPRCDKGQIPCPGSCLRPTVGTWVKDSAGVRWRTFPGEERGSSFRWSERHFGQVTVLKNGKATGEIFDCPICNRKIVIADPACKGTGLVPCAECAKSDSPKCTVNCDHGKTKCFTCDGTGLKKTQ